jgi:3-oxoacyl-[acyl-carrier-protein] synthase-1/3-oxoacyl-[acyl-carrier-protein] synthase II
MKKIPRVAISGMGVVCGPYGNLSELMDYLYSCHPRRLCAPPSRFSADLPDTYPAFCLPDDLAAELTLAGGTLSVGMACRAAAQALSQAGLNIRQAARVGVCLGSSTGASLNFSDHYVARKQNRPGHNLSMQTAIRQNPALALARHWDEKMTGPFFTVTNACSSSTDAIGLGADLIRQDICDVVLAGGTDELSLIPYLGFIRLMVYDRSPCKPFDAGRAGLNLGEGAGVLVLENEARLGKRRGEALAMVAGYGNAVDAYHLTAPHPQGKGLLAAQEQALHEAGIRAGDLAFINAHGTATRDNDKVEALIFKTMFPDTMISATKGATGHTLGAAGAIEAAITVQCLLNGRLPPSPGFLDPDPQLALCPVHQTTAVKGSYAMSQSLAFGGQNAALIFKRELNPCLPF